jgi:hypothetical protein
MQPLANALHAAALSHQRADPRGYANCVYPADMQHEPATHSLAACAAAAAMLRWHTPATVQSPLPPVLTKCQACMQSS